MPGKLSNPCGSEISGQHEQTLANTIPAVDLASAAVQAELGILVGEDLWLRGPEPVRGLESVHGVGSAEFARLHDEGEQGGGQAQEKKRIAKPVIGARGHCWNDIRCDVFLSSKTEEQSAIAEQKDK